MTDDRVDERQQAVGDDGWDLADELYKHGEELGLSPVAAQVIAKAVLDSGVVVPTAELDAAREANAEMSQANGRLRGQEEQARYALAAAERAREEAQRERDELLRQRAEFDTPMQRAAEEAHERAERLGEALDELVRLKDGPRDDAYRAAKDAAWDRARAALARESSPTDACTCGNGEAEEDRGAVLRCPVHGIASSPTEGECS